MGIMVYGANVSVRANLAAKGLEAMGTGVLFFLKKSRDV